MRRAHDRFKSGILYVSRYWVYEGHFKRILIETKNVSSIVVTTSLIIKSRESYQTEKQNFWKHSIIDVSPKLLIRSKLRNVDTI